MQKKMMKHCLVAVMLLASMTASAQVTIGSGKVPESFSVLELVSNQRRGFRLPQMTTVQRDEMSNTVDFQSQKSGEALGLQIFNTSTRCQETWNGVVWIQGCASVPCTGFSTVSFCSDENTTISGLMDKFSITQWYATEEGGDPLAASTPLENGTYYAGGCSDHIGRRAVIISLADCSPILAENAHISTYTNVMYDFQTQVLEAYVTEGGEPVAWQWQVNERRSATDAGGYEDIPGATSATFTIPANFIAAYNTGALENDELFFRCLLANPATPDGVVTEDSNALGIEFIRTNTPGYGITENGDRYLTINNGGGGTFKLALLNLGQSEGNDAADLGDMYQWGRIADGHEKIVWKKNPSNKEVLFAKGTSENVHTDISPSLDANGQVSVSDPLYGKYLYYVPSWNGYSWSLEELPIDLWGNGTWSRQDADISVSDWTYPSNNPCACLGNGWGVPSMWNMLDMFTGNGTDTSVVRGYNGDWQYSDATVNQWRWRTRHREIDSPEAYYQYGIIDGIGGLIITNDAGEKVYLPALGTRSISNGDYANYELQAFGQVVYYWYSTASGNPDYKPYLSVGVGNYPVSIGRLSNVPTAGLPVRCVRE